MKGHRRRLQERFDDACALACSGMLWKSEKTLDSVFFTPKVCDEAPQTFCDRIGETRSGLSPRVAALSSGIGGRDERFY